MTPRYKVGDLFQYNKTEVDEFIVIVKSNGMRNVNIDTEWERKSHSYSCYSLKYGLYMDKTEKFLDLYYKKVA